jgi:hypothetical protein
MVGAAKASATIAAGRSIIAKKERIPLMHLNMLALLMRPPDHNIYHVIIIIS